MMFSLSFYFQGHHFRIAALPGHPYITEMTPEGFSDGTVTFKMKGLFAEVFNHLQVSEAFREEINNLSLCILYDYLTGILLQGIMNFTYTLFKPSDGKWGIIQPDSTWNGMVGELANKEIDIAPAPFSVTKERSAVLTFATPIAQMHRTLFIKNPAEKYNFLAYIEPMRWLVWVGMFGLLITVPPLLYMSIR